MTILIKILAKISFILLIFAYFFIRYRLNRLRHKDYGREFSEQEYNKISGIASSVAAQGKYGEYPLSFKVIYYAALPLLILCIGLTGYAVGWIYTHFRAQLISEFPAVIYDIHANITFPASALIGGVTGMFLWGVIYIIMGRHSESLRTYLVHKGWGGITGDGRSWYDYTDEVAHLVYTKNLTLDNSPASNRAVISHIFERSSQKWLFCTSFMCVITAFFLYLDIHHYSWIDRQKNQVVQNPYFSLTETRYGPEDVTGVIKTCEIASYERPVAHLEYIIIGPTGQKLNLGHEPWDILPFIKAVEESQTIPTETEIDIALALNDLPKTKETCLAHLKHEYDPESRLKAELWALYDF